METPGYICPFCGTDCSPIAGAPCLHLFAVDGENGWRFTELSRPLFERASETAAPLFRDLLYHNAECREYLRLLRADYEDSLEMYAFTSQPAATNLAFLKAIQPS